MLRGVTALLLLLFLGVLGVVPRVLLGVAVVLLGVVPRLLESMERGVTLCIARYFVGV